jgi:hypothetical protein
MLGVRLQIQYFSDRGTNTGECRLVRVARRAVHCTRDAHRQRGRGFRFHREIGQNVLHQRLLSQCLAEGLPMVGVMHGLHQCLPHQGGRPEHAIESGERHHVQNRGDARPSSPSSTA